MHDSRTKSKAKIISSAPAVKFQQGNGSWEIIFFKKKICDTAKIISPRLSSPSVCFLKNVCFTLHEKTCNVMHLVKNFFSMCYKIVWEGGWNYVFLNFKFLFFIKNYFFNIFLNYFDVLILKKIKNIILIYF
jgi:hypothetical protein